MTEKCFSFVFHNWIYLSASYLTVKVPYEERSPGWIIPAPVVYVVNIITRVMCSKLINVIELNLCLDFKKYSLCALCAGENQALLFVKTFVM